MMDIISLPTSGCDIWKIMALMLYPKDTEVQNNWIKHARHCNLLDREKRGLVILGDVIDDLGSSYWFSAADFPKKTKVDRDGNTQAKKGIIAGDVLLHIYLMNESEIKEPSLRKANFIVRSRTYRTKDGKSRKYTEKEISIIWSDFRSVAHLWAALRLNDHYHFIDDIFSSQDNSRVFLSMARTFQEFATTFIPFRAKAPLLPISSLYQVCADIKAGSFYSKDNKTFYEKKLKRYNASTS